MKTKHSIKFFNYSAPYCRVVGPLKYALGLLGLSVAGKLSVMPIDLFEYNVMKVSIDLDIHNSN